MNSSLYNAIYLINSSTIDDIVDTIKIGEHILNIDHTIKLYSIFEYLSDDSRVSEIVQESANQVEKHIIIKILEFTK